MNDEVSTIEVNSGVSLFNGNPFVVVRWGNETGQLTPEEARTHALYVLRCADAAESDATVVGLLRDLGLDEDHISSFLHRMRQKRDEL